MEIIDRQKIQTWLVTGGSTGFGKVLVQKLYKQGYKVAATSRDLSKLSSLPDDIIKIQLDVRDLDSCKKAISTVIEQFGKIDVLVNNAGLSHMSTFEETPVEVGADIMATNYWGVSNMSKCVIPHMRQNKNGTVINISSSSGFRPRNYGSYYVASKFAVESLTKSLKFECSRFMRFMAVELGGLNTGLANRQTVIHPQIDEYKNLPPLYPFEKGYRNSIDKVAEAVINVVNREELPRCLVLGWDAFQQFPQAMRQFEQEVEKYKSITVTTDETKQNIISVSDVVLPRKNEYPIQNWLITGASQGFGKILALRLKHLGYNVCVTSRDISKLDWYPSGFHKIESMLDTPKACNDVVRQAVEKMGSVDVLVNNVTSNCWCRFEECPDDIMKKIFFVNFTISEYMIKAVLPYMRKQKSGTILNLSSVAGIQPRSRVSTYSAAKAAIEGLTRVLYSECRRFARVMAVELVAMVTNIMLHNPVIHSTLPEYKDLGKYTPDVDNIRNRKEIAAQQIINTVNNRNLPRSLLIGTESYLIAKDEIKRSMKDYEDNKDVSLSVCEKIIQN